MRGKTEYLTALYKGNGGGAICLQKATATRESVPMILSMCCGGHSSADQEMIKKAGEWFQNHFVSEVMKKGPTSFLTAQDERAHLFLDKQAKAIITLLSDNQNDFVLVIIVGRYACYIRRGAFGAYLIASEFGRTRLMPFEAVFEGNASAEAFFEVFELEEEVRILLPDREMEDKSGDVSAIDIKKRGVFVADCIHSAGSEEALSRSLREVAECYFDGNIAFVGIACLRNENGF